MSNLTTARMLWASVVAGGAFLILPLVGVIVGWTQMPFLNSDGTPDNAPIRGGIAFVLMSPIISGIVASFAFFVALALRKLGRLTRRLLVIIALVPSAAVGAWFAAASQFGWLDAAIGFFVMGTIVFLASGLAIWAWWRVAVGHQDRATPE